MNQIFSTFVSLVEQLNLKQFYQAVGVVLAIAALCCSVLLYRAYSLDTQYASDFRRINKSRTELKKVVQRKQQVIYQQEQVQKILEENPGFSLRNYFETTLNKLGIQYSVIEPKTTKNATYPEEFTDVTATGTLKDTTMQQLTQFLEEVENNTRVQITNLTITQDKPGVIDATITIATLLTQKGG